MPIHMKKVFDKLEFKLKEIKKLENRHLLVEGALRSELDFTENLLQLIQAVVLILDRQGLVVNCNGYMEELLGWDVAELEGENFAEKCIPEPERENFLKSFKDALENPGPRKNTGSAVTSDGDTRQIEWVKTAIKDSEGKVKGVLVVGHDITELKRTQDELKKAYTELELKVLDRTAALWKANEELKLKDVAISSSLAGVAVMDINGKPIYVNEAALRMFGFDNFQKVAGISIISLADDRREAERYFAELLRKRTWLGEIKVKKKSGESFDAQITGSLIYDDEGNPIAITGSIIDVTKANLSREELIKLQKLETVGILAGGIAHDFNNVLTVITGNVSVAMLDIDSGSELYAMLKEIDEASQKAKMLANKLLTFAQGGDPVKKTISPGKILGEACAITSHMAVKPCKCAFSETLWPIMADEMQLMQAVANIIENAKHVIKPGDLIHLCAENVELGENEFSLPAGRYVKMSIKDEGPGISPDIVDKIFDPFFTTKRDGSGLGLTASFSIIKKHGGHLSVKSEPGMGAVFEILMPAAE